MIYDDYLYQAELQRWVLEADVAWSRVDASLALQQPELLEEVRDSAIIESYFPLYTMKLVQAIWDRVDATAVFSIQLYESYKHFYALNRYLEIVGYRPLDEADIVETRRKNLGNPVPEAIAELTRYMMSEHFAAYFFMRLSRQAREPVLQQISAWIAKDEVRHAQFAFDILSDRLREDPTVSETILNAALRFRHVGSDVVEQVPVAEKNDLGAILSINKKVERLCGKKMTAHAQDQIRNQMKGLHHATI
jgi:hypothetical protein